MRAFAVKHDGLEGRLKDGRYFSIDALKETGPGEAVPGAYLVVSTFPFHDPRGLEHAHYYIAADYGEGYLTIEEPLEIAMETLVLIQIAVSSS